MRIAIAQINPVICDLPGNAEKIIKYCYMAQQEQARIIVFPECSLSGYPIDDIATNPGIYPLIEKQLQHIAAQYPELYIMVGHPEHHDGKFYNAVSILHGGRRIHCYYKQHLPNNGLFDEQRQFSAGNDICLFAVDGITIATAICEDIWSSKDSAQQNMQLLRDAGAMLLLTAHGSPYHPQKHQQRLHNLERLIAITGLPVVCSHLVGGNDNFVFDGASVAINNDGTIALQAPQFTEGIYLLDANDSNGAITMSSECHHDLPSDIDSLYQAIVMATRDFVHKSGHRQVLLGLSGGVDSALTLCIAVDALGAKAVTALIMPSEHSAAISSADAESLARNLGVKSVVIPINKLHNDFVALVHTHWPCNTIDTAAENIQARCRGMLLMTIANRTGSLVLGTGNKSELAVGYSTLYGDTAAGFNPLGDIYKSDVYAMINLVQRNKGQVIPERIIKREPSAELRPGQLDSDSLPPYQLLDEIVRLYAEQDRTAEQIIAAGFPSDVVRDLLHRIESSEYKRRQSPPAPCVSNRSLQRERRYPVCSMWQRTPKSINPNA